MKKHVRLANPVIRLGAVSVLTKGQAVGFRTDDILGLRQDMSLSK